MQFFDMLPVPIEIFAPDGVSIFINKALMEMFRVPDANLVVGKYNLKKDPVCLEVLGQDMIDQIFRGETASFSDFPWFADNVYNSGFTGEKPFAAATVDMFQLPIWDGDKFVCTISFFTVKNMYHGRAEIKRAQEIMQQNWHEEIDMDRLAGIANLSRRHFQRIFRSVTGMTPYDYWTHIRIEKVKEKLLDSCIRIADAFSLCGMDYHGAGLKAFKAAAGQSPSSYRKTQLGTK
jgi:AraC family transcriptional regulator